MDRDTSTMDWLPDERTAPLDAALTYQAHGFRPIPIYAPAGRGCSCRMGSRCQAAGKHPVVRGWQRSHPSERTIRGRWSAWPRANVGLVTGGPARLVVLDIDGDEGRRSLHALEEGHEALPVTWTSATGGGGEQRLFVLPNELALDAISNSVRKLGAGLDVRASSGQIVVAPSLHRSGRLYRWAVRVAMAHLPSWMYALLADLPHASENLSSRARPDAERLSRYGEAAL